MKVKNIMVWFDSVFCSEGMFAKVLDTAYILQ